MANGNDEERFSYMMPQQLVTRPFNASDGKGIRQELFMVMPGVYYPSLDREGLTYIQSKLAEVGADLARVGQEKAASKSMGPTKA